MPRVAVVAAVVVIAAVAIWSALPLAGARVFRLGATGAPRVTGRARPGRDASAPPRAHPGVLDPGRRLEVPLADPLPSRLPLDGTPPGWSLTEFSGHGEVELVRADARLAVRLRSDRSSLAISRDVVVDLADLPILTWSWKVLRLPPAGDVRTAARDDEAAQVYVVFPRWPSPMQRSEVIGYVWDSNAPVGTELTSVHTPNVKLIVVESGVSRVGTWTAYERNVADDYRRLFGTAPPEVGRLAYMTDSNDTHADAEALFGAPAFHGMR